jgi:hypothetical protein
MTKVMRITYPPVVTMDEERMIRLVESDLHDSVHNSFRNFNLLCALHIDDDVPNTMILHESFEFGRKVFLHQRAGSISATAGSGKIRGVLHYGLQA